MPIEITDLDGGMGSLIVGHGVVTRQEYVDTMTRHLRQDTDKFAKYKYGLCDYSAVTKAEALPEDIREIANLCRGAARVAPGAVVAMVAATDIVYGLARMWESLLDEMPWHTMVFTSRPDAEKWLKEKVKETFGLDGLTLRST